jgi:homoserine O-acetyltransferase/O-succinyltransferase
VLKEVVQRVSIYGKPAADGSNVVLVAHALTGSSRAADWWGGLIGRGKLLDPKRFAVVGINAIGGCYGSTGPGTLGPKGIQYGSSFPLVTVSDIVRAQAAALANLGIPRVHAVIGGSLGGMQALAWALQRPKDVDLAVAVGAYDHFSAMGIALNAIAREAITNDRYFAYGDYYGNRRQPTRGIELARKIAMLTYKSEALLAKRFERKVDRKGGDPYRFAADRFDVEGYLDYQGQIFSKRMDANSYLTLTRAMDLFDLRDHPVDGSGTHLPEIVLVGITGDWLFLPTYVRATAERLAAAGARATYLELESDHGHDAFLAEPEALSALLKPFFSHKKAELNSLRSG